jgi:hypothetical protein
LSKRGSTPQPRYDPSAPRVSKREQLRQQRRRRSMMWNVIVLGTLGLFALAVGAYVVANQRPGPLPGETRVADEGAAVYPAGQALNYRHYPPSSGSRYAEPAPWGLASEPVPEGNFVTNLYRGGVVFLYQCAEPCPELEQQFQTLLDQAPPDDRFNSVKILVSPYERELETPIVALAWNYQLNLSQFDEAMLLRWYQRFVNRGPETLP